VTAIMCLYYGSRARVRTHDGTTDAFYLSKGVLQGDTLAPYLFIIVMDYILRRALSDPSLGYGLNVESGLYITDLVYADDIAIIARTREHAEAMLRAIEREASLIGLFVNKSKTLAMTVPAPTTSPAPITLESEPIAWTTDFKYLGSMIMSSESDLRHRIGLAWGAFRSLDRLWNSALDCKTKAYLFSSTVVPVLLYGCETWTLNLALRKLLWATYNKMLRKVMNIRWWMHVSNEELYRRAGCNSPAFQVRERMLRFVHRTLNGPEQCAQTLIRWKHGLKKNSSSKRKISYRDQLLRLIGDKGAYPPAAKRARIDGLLNYIVDPAHLQWLVNAPPTIISDFQDIISMDIEI
jgi:Reverse transcriptase (RNA-dependent DNA polymerase)